MKTVAQKMGINNSSRAYLKDAPTDVLDMIQLPEMKVSKQLKGEFDYIHLFVTQQTDQEAIFEKLKQHLAIDGMLWVSWPKGGQLNTDLTLPKVIKSGYQFGLVESTCLSINSVWSALKLTHPKKGKVYNNSYGELKGRATNR